MDDGASTAGYIGVHVVRNHHHCNHTSTGKVGFECCSGANNWLTSKHLVDTAEGASGTPPEALHSRCGHVRCSHVSVLRMLVAGLDYHILDSIRTSRNKLGRSLYDSPVYLRSLLHESGCVFYRRRPLSFRIDTSRLQEGHGIIMQEQRQHSSSLLITGYQF